MKDQATALPTHTMDWSDLYWNLSKWLQDQLNTCLLLPGSAAPIQSFTDIFHGPIFFQLTANAYLSCAKAKKHQKDFKLKCSD